MKKLLVVFTAILVVAFAAPAFATDATWSGEFDFGGITAFDEADIGNAWVNAYADVTLDVDDYTEVLLELTWQNGGSFGVGVASATTDLGMALGLPVGLEMTGGYTSIWSNKFEVTGHATERVLVRSYIGDPVTAGSSPMFVAAVDAGMATIKAGVGFVTGPMQQNYAVYVDAPGIADMVDLEAGYFILADDDFKGRFMASAKATDIADMIDAAAGFAYDAQAAGGVGAEKWFWGAGVKANVSMFGIGVGVNGQEEAAFQTLTVDVNVEITDEFGVDVGLGLGFGDAMETFGGLEPSVYYTAGAGTWRLGYLYRTDDAAASNNYMYTAPTAAPDPTGNGSGLFLNVGLDF